MDQRETWSPGAKMLTVSVVGLLLSLGMCGVGNMGFFPGAGFLFGAGSILFVVSLALCGIGMIMFLFTDR